MNIAIQQGDDALQLEVSERVFGAKFNEPLIHQIVVAYQAGLRSGTVAQKTRAQVRGGGRKPWRQKGTGRARAGTIRSPIWRGGGKIFAAGPLPQNHSQKVNRKMYRGAMRSIFSELLRQQRLSIVKAFEVNESKTKVFLELLKSLGKDTVKQLCVLVDDFTEQLFLSSRNLPGVYLCDVSEIDPVTLLKSEQVLMTEGAVRQLEELLGHD